MKKLLFLLFALIITINAVAQMDTIKQEYKKNYLKFNMVLLGFKNIHMGYEYRVSQHSAFGIRPSYCIRPLTNINKRQEESFSVNINYKYIIADLTKKKSFIRPYFNFFIQYKYYKFMGRAIYNIPTASYYTTSSGPLIYNEGSAYTIGLSSGINFLIGNALSINPSFGLAYNFDNDPIEYYDYSLFDPTYNGFYINLDLEIGFVF